MIPEMLKAIRNAVRKDMTVFDYSPMDDKYSSHFQELVGKKGKVISIVPNSKTVSLDSVLENTHVDIIYANIQGKTLPFMGAAEDVFKRDRPITFITIDKYSLPSKHGYSIKDIRDFMLSVGYMNMKLARDSYVFTYEHHPSKVLL